MICRFDYDFNDIAPNAANDARLIAAAPKLLEAAKKVADKFQPTSTWAAVYMGELRAAISAAEDRTS